MKPVIQKEISGCGIASVATLAGVGYAAAKAKAPRCEYSLYVIVTAGKETLFTLFPRALQINVNPEVTVKGEYYA